MLECWSVGVLECWSVGVLECWSVGVRIVAGEPFSIKKFPNSCFHKAPWRNQWFIRQRDQHIVIAESRILRPRHSR